MKSKKAESFLRAAGCGLISFALVFYLIPKFLSSGASDILWMALEVVLPALVAMMMLERVHPVWVFISLPIHYGLLFLLATPLSEVWCTSLERPLGWSSYIGATFTWPLIVTVVQFYMLRFRRKRR